MQKHFGHGTTRKHTESNSRTFQPRKHTETHGIESTDISATEFYGKHVRNERSEMNSLGEQFFLPPVFSVCFCVFP